MHQLSSILRATACAGVVLLLASACGGKSFVEGGEQTGGSGAQGGTGSGSGGSSGSGHAGSGTAGKGGQPTSGGQPTTGGSSNGGVATGGQGTAGSGGATQGGDGCSEAPDPGPCDAYLPTWSFDAASGLCRPSYYGGCGGNKNRYGSLADCQKACSSTHTSYDSCERNADCRLGGMSCCGVCDSPNLTVRDFISYNAKYPGTANCALAGDKAAPAGGNGNIGAPIACAPCMTVPDGVERYFVPECVAGRCAVTDMRQSPATACEQSSDCKLRNGTSCCNSCDASDVFAVRNDGSFEDLVCGGILPPCAACPPPNTDSGAVAVCASGHCQVAYAGAP